MRPPRRRICAASSQSSGPCPAITVRPSGHQRRRFQHGLRGARGHHARQGPAGNRKRPLQRAGREDHALRLDEGRGAADRDADLEVAVEAPDRGAVDDLGAARAQRLHEIGADPIVGAELVALGHRRRGDGAIDLAAGADVLVEQQRREAGFGGGRGGREARRARRRSPRRRNLRAWEPHVIVRSPACPSGSRSACPRRRARGSPGDCRRRRW